MADAHSRHARRSPTIARRRAACCHAALQTWLMVGLALGILGDHRVRRASPSRQRRRRVTDASRAPLRAESDRLRDYQDRLRVLDERARDSRPSEPSRRPPSPQPVRLTNRSRRRATPDPLEAERRRREYESLFASNVVLSRRPEGQRSDATERTTSSSRDAHGSREDGLPAAAEPRRRRGCRRARDDAATPPPDARPLPRRRSPARRRVRAPSRSDDSG